MFSFWHPMETIEETDDEGRGAGGNRFSLEHLRDSLRDSLGLDRHSASRLHASNPRYEDPFPVAVEVNPGDDPSTSALPYQSQPVTRVINNTYQVKHQGFSRFLYCLALLLLCGALGGGVAGYLVATNNGLLSSTATQSSSMAPTTPTAPETLQPTISIASFTKAPTPPTHTPTSNPSAKPTKIPTLKPSQTPTSSKPSLAPTSSPSRQPVAPTMSPSKAPLPLSGRLRV